MKINPTILVLSLLIIFLFTCDDGTTTNVGKNPVIEEIKTNYIAKEKSLFNAVETDDPQGYDDVKTVVYWLYYAETDSSAETEIATGAFYDDGTHGDIIQQDAAFSQKFYNMEKGTYRVVAEAFDHDDNASDMMEDTISALDNFTPEIYLISAPNSFEKGDTINFEVKVTDRDGMDDIFFVRVQIETPDGELLPNSYYMRDDGLFSDKTAEDGIYSISFPTNESSKNHGLWTFYFVALDKGRAYSNEISRKLRNPGVAVLFPDGGETFTTGETIKLTWDCIFVDTVVVKITGHADQENPDFITITEQPSRIKEFDWTIPDDLQSEACKIYIYDKQNPFRFDYSDDFFEVQ